MEVHVVTDPDEIREIVPVVKSAWGMQDLGQLVKDIVAAMRFHGGLGGNQNVVIIQQSEITVSASYIGNNTYQSGDISYAFVENIGSGNLTLSHKDYGTNAGNINEGRFTLSNGAGADVVTDNVTCLVVLLHSGLYLVLGCNNTQLLADDFSSSVYQMPGYP